MADEQQTETPTTGPEQPTQEQPESPKPQPPAREAETGDDGTDWKAEARKWESRAKENSSAAARLVEIEDANKTEAQRAADAQKSAEERAIAAEARVLRREVALEHSLSKDDAGLLDGITDEDAMRALAARLATPVAQRHGNTAPLEGATPSQPLNDDRLDFVQGLVANARTQ